jgi:hypothetical protein
VSRRRGRRRGARCVPAGLGPGCSGADARGGPGPPGRAQARIGLLEEELRRALQAAARLRADAAAEESAAMRAAAVAAARAHARQAGELEAARARADRAERRAAGLAQAVSGGPSLRAVFSGAE